MELEAAANSKHRLLSNTNFAPEQNLEAVNIKEIFNATDRLDKAWEEYKRLQQEYADASEE